MRCHIAFVVPTQHLRRPCCWHLALVLALLSPGARAVPTDMVRSFSLIGNAEITAEFGSGIPYGWFGIALASLGDLDGDGFEELAVGNSSAAREGSALSERHFRRRTGAQRTRV
jgi:hypothetical protein